MRKLFTIIIVLFTTISYAQLCFNPDTILPVGSMPSSVVSADFNHDGKKDLAVSNNQANSITIFLGNGAGNFSLDTNITLPSTPAQLILGYFNGDSAVDIIAVGGVNNVWVLLGTGTGSFSAPNNFSVSLYPSSACSADFNQDGKLDLAVGNGNTANSISILLGTGTGSFGSATDFTVGTCPCGSSCLTSADFNGDTIPDLAVANQNSNDVSILLGTGTGSFGAATNFAVGSWPWSVVAADFTGDGIADLATSNQNSNNLSVLIGAGNGSFSAATNFIVGDTPESIIGGDFNGDSIIDLVTANKGSNNVSVMIGTGTGSFSSAINFPAGNGPFALCGADFNANGKKDLAVTDFNSDSITILINCSLFTGVEELSESASVVLFPNPATNQLFIEAGGMTVTEINIYNSTGSLVSQTKQPQSKSIDISQLANGVYIAEIKTKEASVKKRWVKM